MFIKLLTSRVGPFHENHSGEVIDLPEEEANQLIQAGSAEAVSEELVHAMGLGDVQTATLPEPKTRTNKGK